MQAEELGASLSGLPGLRNKISPKPGHKKKNTRLGKYGIKPGYVLNRWERNRMCK